MEPVVSNVNGGIGAACGAWKGSQGRGQISAGGEYCLHDLTWKTSVGGTLPIYGSGQRERIAKGASGTDLDFGLVQAEAGHRCWAESNTPRKSGGAYEFLIAGVRAIVHDGWMVHPESAPRVCKATVPTCLWGPPASPAPETD